MECLLVALILVASVIGLVIVGIASARGGHWNEAFAHVARRFHGVLHPGGWFRVPSVWILHGEAQGRLTVGKIHGSSERFVQMSIQQRDVRGRCEIFYHQTRGALLPLTRGLSPIEFDWEEFRRRWHVLASDGDEIRHLLTDGVRLAIEMAWRQPLPGEMTVSLSPGWMVVRKTWKTPRGIDLEAFIERVCALSDQFNLAAASGIEFVMSDEPQLLESARCGVCGDNLADEIVICNRCNTPHHRDCWQYGGGCATYGCGGRECFVPGVAPLAPPLAPRYEEQLHKAERPLKPR